MAGGSANGKANTSSEFFSNNQSGELSHSVTHGSHEHAIDFRLMGLFGKVSNRLNISNTCIYTTRKIVSPHAHARRDEPNATVRVASVGAWMLPTASAEYQSVDGMCLPNTQFGTAAVPNSA